jgi:hypothetical protein
MTARSPVPRIAWVTLVSGWLTTPGRNTIAGKGPRPCPLRCSLSAYRPDDAAVRPARHPREDATAAERPTCCREPDTPASSGSTPSAIGCDNYRPAAHARRADGSPLVLEPHDCRRAFASEYLNNTPVHVIAALLGHATLDTVMVSTV